MKVMNAILISLALLLFSGAAAAQTYVVNADASEMAWIGEKVTGQHNGTINIKEGEFTIDGENMSGAFVIDMNSLYVLDIPADNENHAKLTGHLKSDDFFSVGTYPEATFTVTKVLPYRAREGETANYKVTGDLTIKGITNEISFPAHIDIADGKMTAKASFSVDRSRWNVRYGSGTFFDNLGDKLIYDDFHIDLNLVGSAQ